ncbi:MAG: hypothetical protein RIC55_29220 [Pirellulaceae bacterium]
MRKLPLVAAVLIAVLPADAAFSQTDQTEPQPKKAAPMSFGQQIWDGPTGIYSYDLDTQFLVELPRPPVGPIWKMGEPNPPLSVRDAIAQAVKLRNKLVHDEKNCVWGLKGALLTPWDAENGYWYWEVEFEQQILVGGSTGIPANLRLVVLMDGTVVKVKEKPQR